MFTLQLYNVELKRYKLQWYNYNGKKRYVEFTHILHAPSLDNVKDRALQLFGSKPDSIMRI